MTEPAAPTEKTYTAKDIEIERAHAQAAREEARELKERFKDIDPEEFRRIREEHTKLKTKDAGGDEKKIAELVAEQLAPERKRLESAYQEEKTAREKLASELKTERVTKAILQKAASAFGQDALELLTPVFERDGDFVDGKVVFKGPDGKPRYSPTDATKLLSIEEYIGELQTKYPSAAVSTASGGGKNGVAKVSGASGGQLLSAAQVQALPDSEQKKYFATLARTPEGLKVVESYLGKF